MSDKILECQQYGAGSCRNEDMIEEIKGQRDFAIKELDRVSGALMRIMDKRDALRDAAQLAREALIQDKTTCYEAKMTLESEGMEWDAHKLCIRSLGMIDTALAALDAALGDQLVVKQ